MKAKDLKAGDVVEVPGWMLHEDLSGLTFQIGPLEKVAPMLRTSYADVARPEQDEIIEVTHQQGRSCTWFYADEEVRVIR